MRPVIVLLLDAVAGVRQTDRDLYMRLTSLGRPVIVALNKMDMIGSDRTRVLADAERRMGGVHIIPISARRGDGVATELMPAIFGADPGMAVAIGRSLPGFPAVGCHTGSAHLCHDQCDHRSGTDSGPWPFLFSWPGHIRLVLQNRCHLR